MASSDMGLSPSGVGFSSSAFLTRLVQGWTSGTQSGSLAVSWRRCFAIRDVAGEIGDSERLLVGVCSLAGLLFVSILYLFRWLWAGV